MRILATGSSGRVGRLLVGKLLDQNHEVVGLDLQPSKRVHDRYLEVVGNPNDEKRALEATAGVEAEVHLGVLMSWDPRDEAALFAANVDRTRAILATSAEAGVRRFVFASSGEDYRETSPKFLPITEEHPLEPTPHTD